MYSRLRRRFFTTTAFAVAMAIPSIALAQSDAEIYRTSVIQPANDALKEALRHQHETHAQARPVGEPEKPIAAPGLPTGFSYTLDASIAYPYGSTNYDAHLPGGFDAVAGYGFNRHVRLQLGYYILQEYPIGFNQGNVPVYLQGFPQPIGAQDLGALHTDLTTRNKIATGFLQTLFTIGGKLPIIISPGYIARSGTIGGHTDSMTLEINGAPQTVRVRTVEYKLVAVTLPFLSTPKMFGTITLAPQWLMNTNGANQTNHPQLFELAYLEYRPNSKTTFFIQPSRLANYLPPDAYPQFIPTEIYGVSHKFTKNTFVQFLVENGTPSNIKNLGITSITLQSLSGVNAVPAINGLKASQIQIQFGIGSPSVIPL